MASGAVRYYFSDHLGSASVITDETGGVVEESQYFPFGGERAVVNSDPNRYKFTGKERDSETGLDYFGARYYGSNMGRFLSPDEFTGGPVDVFDNDPTQPGPLPYADITNPQSLNKYSYTYNNPLRYTDPDGHCPMCALAGAVAGGGASIVYHLWTNPAQDVNWRQVGGAAVAGAIVGGTMGMASEAALPVVQQIVVGSSASVVGGIADRTVQTGSLNKAMENPKDIATDAVVGAVSAGVAVAGDAAVGAKSAGRLAKLEQNAARSQTTKSTLKQLNRLNAATEQMKGQQAKAGVVVGLVSGVVEKKITAPKHKHPDEK